ncbi:MAG: hypothetical protein AAFU77_16895 [Myxococcota bacterium]
MKLKSLVAPLALALVFAACGDDDGESNDDMGPPDFTTGQNILNFLDGATLTMRGDNIPTHPNGFFEGLDAGAATQCYNETLITVASGQFSINSQLGTLENLMPVGDFMIGECNRDEVSGPFSDVTTAVSFTGDADCFDISVTYTGFAQEGRGSINADGTELRMELYFATQPAGATCGDGAVGDGADTVNGVEFTGDATQIYVVTR